MATQLYATDRNGLLYILDPTNFTFPSWAPGPMNVPTILGVNAGPALYGLTFDPSTNGLFFVGLPNGANGVLYGFVPNDVSGQKIKTLSGADFYYYPLCYPTPINAFQPD